MSAQHLAAQDLRRNLLAMLERRLPKEDVDDVAQTVLCDALSAERIPSDPIEMRRWLAGIARHKVADFHRKRARVNGRTTRLDDDDSLFEPAVPPAPIEARSVLAGVIDETAPSPRDRETLGWIVREHEGDRLADIAKEEGIPSPVVRQRVSRLRRALRQRWATALLLLLCAGAAGGYAMGNSGGGEPAAITADPTATVQAPAAAPAGPFDGTWRVEKIEPKMQLTKEQRAMLDAEIPTARVKVQGTRIEITAHAGTLVVTAKDFRKDDSGGFDATVSAGNGASQRVHIQPQGQKVRISIKEGRFAGEAVLAR